jgi:hypothetical protein
VNNQHLRFTKDNFTVTTDPAFFSWKPFTITSRNRPGLLVLMSKRSGYPSRTAFVLRFWMEQDKSASPVWSQTMPLLVICATSTC